MFGRKAHRYQSASQRIKQRARRTLQNTVPLAKKSYVVDTSVVIHKFLPRLIKRGLTGRIIIPNAVMSELENQANKGLEAGFIGLDEIANLHKLKKQNKIAVFFQGIRPNETHIRYAKSGEIDALIREIATRNNAILVTADLVQAKSAQAYGLEVIFLRPKIIPQKKPRRFLFFRRKNRPA